MLFVSPILGAPELTVPSKTCVSPVGILRKSVNILMLVGHSPFLSRNTGNEEKLPIAISILGSPGTLLFLLF